MSHPHNDSNKTGATTPFDTEEVELVLVLSLALRSEKRNEVEL